MKSNDIGIDRSEFRPIAWILSQRSAKNRYPPFNMHTATKGSEDKSVTMSRASLSILNHHKNKYQKLILN